MLIIGVMLFVAFLAFIIWQYGTLLIIGGVVGVIGMVIHMEAKDRHRARDARQKMAETWYRQSEGIGMDEEALNKPTGYR